MFATDDSYALVIGITHYAHLPPLQPTVAHDAQDIHALLLDPQHCRYPQGNVRLLLDAAATQTAVRYALASLSEQTRASSTVLIYFAGRAGRLTSGPYAGEYLLPADACPTADRTLAETSIAGTEFDRGLRAIPARNLVVVFDICSAGAQGGSGAAGIPGFIGGLPDRYYNTLKAARGRIILASAHMSEEPWTPPGGSNSLFAQHMMAGLRGDAAGADGVVGALDLFEYVRANVTAAYSHQSPTLKVELEDNVPLARATAGTPPGDDLSAVTAGYVRITLARAGASWSLIAQNVGHHDLTAISITLRPPASVFISDTVIDIPRLPVARSSTARELTLHSSAARAPETRARSDQGVGGANARLIERERSRLERRIEQLLDTIDQLQEERDVATGMARMQLDQQIDRQKQTLQQYEHDLDQLDARAQGMALPREASPSHVPQSSPSMPVSAPAIARIPFSVTYRMVGSPPERVEGVLSVALI